MVLMAGFVGTASAEEPEVLNAEVQDLQEVEATQKKTTIELPAWVKNIKFSGYGMLQYQGQDPEGNHSNSFNLRLARFILDGKIGDFDWRAQLQAPTPQVPDSPPYNSLTSTPSGANTPSSRSAPDSSSAASPSRTPPTPSHRVGAAMPT